MASRQTKELSTSWTETNKTCTYQHRDRIDESVRCVDLFELKLFGVTELDVAEIDQNISHNRLRLNFGSNDSNKRGWMIFFRRYKRTLSVTGKF